MRDGEIQRILGESIIPGDLISLKKEGISADKTYQHFGLRVNQSTHYISSGKSRLLNRSIEGLTEAETPNLFAGTFVAAGSGKQSFMPLHEHGFW